VQPSRPALNPELGSGGGEQDPARGFLFFRGRELHAYGQAQAVQDLAGRIDGEAVGAIQDAGVIAGKPEVVECLDQARAVVDVDGVDGGARRVVEEDIHLGQFGAAAVQEIGHGQGDMEPVGGVLFAPECGAPAFAGDFVDVIRVFRIDDVAMDAHRGFGGHGLGGGIGAGELHMGFILAFYPFREKRNWQVCP
jgi:hypothetical protein